MEKLTFPFSGIRVTNQPNGTHHLILVVKNDMHASQIYPVLAISTSLSLRYSENQKLDSFTIFVDLNDTQRYYEIELNITEETKYLSSTSKRLITDLWIGHPINGKVVPYGSAMAFSNDH